MTITIGRRQFISIIGSAAVVWPLATRAQAAMPVIGFLGARSNDTDTPYIAAFHEGLKEIGYIEGKNVAIEYRWAHGRNDLLRTLAIDLVSHQVSIIVCNSTSATAAKDVTSSIPIVFVAGGDPVQTGLVASLNRPGGNLTGINQFTYELDPKRLGLLHDLVPSAAMIGVLLNPKFTYAEKQLKGIQDGARALGQQTIIQKASSEGEINAEFAKLAEMRIGALLVAASPFFLGLRDQLIALAAQNAVPAIYEWRDFADAVGLMSYGTSMVDSYRQLGIYAGRVLNGEKPAEMPVLQPTKFELVINLKTAKILGLKISDNLLSLADEVIE
jgi:putative ABC transport system substrate-binding protein